MSKVEFNFGSFTRFDFPSGFLFGAASAAFQYEGAHNVDGRLPSIWDTFLKENHPDLVADNALDAIKFYDRFQEDVKIMKVIGLDTFRFSISWPRVLPSGRRSKGPNGEELGVNHLGIDFYNNLIDILLANGIQPNVTLFHWDLPQTLEDEYLGFLSERVVDDFVDYADLCFEKFGDRVKFWMTVNETWSYAIHGYLTGTAAPGRGATDDATRAAMEDALPSSQFKSVEAFKRTRTPTAGDPTTEPYKVAHNQLLAHAAAVKLYRSKYQATQKGQIGFGLVSIWTVPHTDSNVDKAAAERVLEFMLGWLIDPLVFGKYPESMRKLVGIRLPEFTPEQAKGLIGSFDFLGMNYYTTNSVANLPVTRSVIYNPDSRAICYNYGKPTGSSWVYSYPQGLEELQLYVKKKYNNPPIYITENGVDQREDNLDSFWESLYDTTRVTYLTEHLQALRQAISKGANIKGYYVWSFFDNLEWQEGFEPRFGINYIRFDKELERYPKLSAGWYKFFLQKLKE